MLDKSIPYYNIIMKRKKRTPIEKSRLPEGFSFVFYQKGDEVSWAEIEASVLEFDSTEEALNYFKGFYLQHPEEIKRRCLFIENDKHEKVATFTIWWDKLRPSVHWVGVKPEYQNLGLGKALVFKGIEESIKLLGDVAIYLHTQTWSYKAIGIYQQAGFEILKRKSFGDYQNDYKKALPIIEEKMKRAQG